MLHVAHVLVHVACYWRPRPSTDTASAQLLRQGDGGRTPFVLCSPSDLTTCLSPAYLQHCTALEQARADADAANRSVAATGGAGHGMGRELSWAKRGGDERKSREERGERRALQSMTKPGAALSHVLSKMNGDWTDC